jgi:hypothetical protein
MPDEESWKLIAQLADLIQMHNQIHQEMAAAAEVKCNAKFATLITEHEEVVNELREISAELIEMGVTTPVVNLPDITIYLF